MEQESSTGPVVATVIVVILLVVGGYYLLKKPAAPAVTPETPVVETPTTTPVAQGPADDIQSIENDANMVNVSDLATSTGTIDKDLSQ
jgi:hypothetical protein